jgi:glycosyltransferase involved in cell wall biosynthesis
VSDPLFSVVTIFLDAERFLGEAVDSVLAQDHPNWELLLVDDGSTDGSRDLARSLAERDGRIRYVEHPGHENRGMGASRNLGLEHARGEYTACLDSDDTWLPDTLSRHVDSFDRNPRAGMSYGSAEWWWSWDPDAERADWCDGAGAKVDRPGSVIEPPEVVKLFLRDGGAVPCWCSVAFRTQALRDVGGFDQYARDPIRDLYEDQVVFSKIFLEKPVFATGDVLGRYRQHPAQLCSRMDEETQRAARERFLRWLSGYAEERGLADDELRAALDDAIGALPGVH